MRYDKIRLVGQSNIDLPKANLLGTDRYLLMGADGLGPVEHDVAIGMTATNVGIYDRRTPALREVVLGVGLQPVYRFGETPESLRTALYGLLHPGPDDDVLLQLVTRVGNTDLVVAQVTGYVSKIVPALFTEEPQVQITIACTSPYFKSPSDVVYIDANPVVEFTKQIENLGTAPAGFETSITFDANVTNFHIEQSLSHPLKGLRTKQMEFAYDFKTGDTLRIDTRPGSRAATLTKAAGGTANMVGYMTDTSQWILLHPGINNISLKTTPIHWSWLIFQTQWIGV